MLASSLHHLSYVGLSWALVVLQRFRWDQSFYSLNVPFACSGFSCYCSQLSLSSGCFVVNICTFLHWGFQCDGGCWVQFTRLSRLPSRLNCGPLLSPGTSPTPIYCQKGWYWLIFLLRQWRKKRRDIVLCWIEQVLLLRVLWNTVNM